LKIFIDDENVQRVNFKFIGRFKFASVVVELAKELTCNRKIAQPLLNNRDKEYLFSISTFIFSMFTENT
jgi:hypothetical protein